jgi:hypothetical protein
MADKRAVDSLLMLLTQRGTMGLVDSVTACPACGDREPDNQRKTHANWVSEDKATCTFECRKCRRIFVFRFIQGLSNEEIADNKSNWAFDRELVDATGTNG